MQVVYQDAYLIAVLKPAGIPSLPERGGSKGQDALAWIRQQVHKEAHLLHRLDKPTSGILLASWEEKTFRDLYAQFAEHRVEKKYWALVQGEPSFEAAELLAPISSDPPRIDPHHGKTALTIAHTLEIFRGYALVVCIPATGRMHQVRLHLSYYGFPIVGDTKYGGKPLYLSNFHPHYKPSRKESERPLHPPESIFLHAGYLAFEHPTEKRKLTIEAALPEYFDIALKQLRRWASRHPMKTRA
ncbi:MAG: RluA family pseudouridine synthase [Bacteroidia bacterium]|nr:RluA family pseudouridine synthase [Bacteroidia bacterium]MDW8133764.1 RluA family pseudouridine synthase [Bacteroidia bacterium]